MRSPVNPAFLLFLAGLLLAVLDGCGQRGGEAPDAAGVTPGYSPVVDTTLVWSPAEADSARVLSVLFPVSRIDRAYRLRVLPAPADGRSPKEMARLRARIVRPGGQHLIGLDLRLFPEKRGAFLHRRRVWPQGDLNFQPDRTGWHRVEVVRRGLAVRRARVRIEESSIGADESTRPESIAVR